LNGALLGHTRSEIKEKYQDIIEFSEIADFINAPVQTYSSGMQARLGFAVASAWQPEVLILDEVLSVGDVAFQ
jgi:ABC-type polysaccharide/polyol phosphate transport system ATPase subunit